jgi:hypothetical protein
MSFKINPFETNPFQTSPFQASPFLERLIRLLIPFFSGVVLVSEATRTEILENLASYGARTRAELLNAVQAVAFAMSALDMLHEAKITGMSPAMRLRFHGCANNLSRSSQKQEQTLTQRLACDQPGGTRPATGAISKPAGDVPETAPEVTAEDVRDSLERCRQRLFGAGDASAASQSPFGSAMLAALAEEAGVPFEPLYPI